MQKWVGSLEEHKRRNPQLSAFNYNYPLLLPFWLMKGDLIFFSPFSAPLPHCPRIEKWSEMRVLLPYPLVTGRKADSRGW